MSAVLSAALTGAALILLRQLFVAIMREPIRRMAFNLRSTIFLSRICPFKSKTFEGKWEFTWTVESENFPPSNYDTVKVYKFLDRLAAEAYSTTKSGRRVKYGILGQLSNNIITGTWYDREDQSIGYHGSYQLVLSPMGEVAAGKWVGFSAQHVVKSGDFTWRNLKHAPLRHSDKAAQ